MSLGYISTIALATGGPTNPVGIAVTIGAGVATVISRFLKIGAGRDEADYLTDPQTGAQTHAGLAMDEITAQFWNQPEAWTDGFVESTVEALEKIGVNFEAYAIQFPRAGQGAIETIWYWIQRAIADIRAVPRVPEYRAPSSPAYPSIRQKTSPDAGFPVWLIVVAAVLIARS